MDNRHRSCALQLYCKNRVNENEETCTNFRQVDSFNDSAGVSQYYKIYLLTNIVQRDYIANDVKSVAGKLYVCAYPNEWHLLIVGLHFMLSLTFTDR